jgi:hypothetical protein
VRDELLDSVYFLALAVDRRGDCSRTCLERRRPVGLPIFSAVEALELTVIANGIAEDESTLLANGLRIVNTAGCNRDTPLALSGALAVWTVRPKMQSILLSQ